MRFDWRVSAGAAGAAFFLSLMAGLVSGVPFATLLVRAFVGAVVFAAGAIAISYVVDKYLPDLKATGTRASDESGNMVDIVVDDPMDDDVATQEFELDESDGDDDGEEIDSGEVAELETAGDGTEEEDVEVVDEAAELEEAPDAELPGRLPDIEGLSDGFSGGHAEVEDGEVSGRSGDDPSLMARAVRTVLKREE